MQRDDNGEYSSFRLLNRSQLISINTAISAGGDRRCFSENIVAPDASFGTTGELITLRVFNGNDNAITHRCCRSRSPVCRCAGFADLPAGRHERAETTRVETREIDDERRSGTRPWRRGKEERAASHDVPRSRDDNRKNGDLQGELGASFVLLRNRAASALRPINNERRKYSRVGSS